MSFWIIWSLLRIQKSMGMYKKKIYERMHRGGAVVRSDSGYEKVKK